MGRTREKHDIWGEVLMEKGYMRVPRVLRLRRAELGIGNKEYAILLDYLDYYNYSKGQNPYPHLAQVNGLTERTVQQTMGGLEKKGLIERVLKKHPSGRTKGVVFSIAPLLKKLGQGVKGPSPTEGEESFAYGGEESAAPNTREVIYESRESKKNVLCDEVGESLRQTRERFAMGAEASASQRCRGIDREASASQRCPQDKINPGTEAGGSREGNARSGGVKLSPATKPKDPYNSTKWYNEVFAEIYREASGQPVLTGGREYGAARTYFSRLKELNPLMSAQEIYERATDGARFMLESQAEGGVFGWMHCPPDICMLSSQAQSVDYHLRKTVIREGGRIERTDQKKVSEARELREEEADYASEDITRIYGELRGLGGRAQR